MIKFLKNLFSVTNSIDSFIQEEQKTKIEKYKEYAELRSTKISAIRKHCSSLSESQSFKEEVHMRLAMMHNYARSNDGVADYDDIRFVSELAGAKFLFDKLRKSVKKDKEYLLNIIDAYLQDPHTHQIDSQFFLLLEEIKETIKSIEDS